jgi:hypothetical protein
VSNYPRETVEFIVINPTKNGVPTAADEYQLTTGDNRPDGTWLPVETLEGEVGFMLDGLPPDRYLIWVRPDGASPEEPVICAGAFIVN